MQMRWLPWMRLLQLIALFACMAGQASAVHRFNMPQGYDEIGHNFRILEDPTGQYQPEAAARTLQAMLGPITREPQTFTDDVKIVWLLFELNNATSESELVLHQQWLTDGRAFRIDDGKISPLYNFPHRYPVFRLDLPQGHTTTLLLAVEKRLGDIQLHIQITTFKHFWESTFFENKIFALTMYVMGILGFISLILALAFRQKFYFYNAAYILGFDLFLLAMHGLVNIPYYPFVVVLVPAIGLTLSRFNAHFFNLDPKSPIERFQKIVVLLSFSLFAFWWATGRGLALSYLATSIVTFVSIVLTFQEARKGDLSAKVLLLGWSMLILSSLVGIFHVFVASSELTSYICLFSFLAEAIFFNISLALKVRLKEQTINRLNDHMFEQLSKVFYPHQIELMRKGEPLEATMPLGKGEACVICFDIISSSSLIHPDTSVFLQNVIKHCQESMLEGYDGNRLRAAAFRIKEMGDGFLCSVGYPFQALEDNPAEAALKVSHTFYKIFQDEVARLPALPQVGCSIAIAHGPLSSFFPQSGTREYDLYGKAIILATRYEQMRRVLFPNIKGSILITDARTFHLLNKSSQSTFSAVDIKARGIVIRDDAAAEQLHYCLFPDNPIQQGFEPLRGHERA
ncbi:MAG TPA: 7TM diverse intracellular signaling domain-containing protein [Oligoflexus sp.]|nr:7TM diverse intracellular signaling domain-containing protein [Oligoflexus sp.]